VSAGGRLTVALYTIRHVLPGEELTFDYASVTESEDEFKQAFCMCSSRSCRGSYLHYTGKAYMQVRQGTGVNP
jgi:SET domain-containing protein